jgi:hypothetical protein
MTPRSDALGTASRALPAPASLALAALGSVVTLAGWDTIRTGLRHGFLPWHELPAFFAVGVSVGIATILPILLVRRELVARVLQPSRHLLLQVLVAALDVAVFVRIAAFESVKTASDLQRGTIVIVLGLAYCGGRVLAARYERLGRLLALAAAFALVGVTELLSWRLLDRTRCALDLFAVGLAAWALAQGMAPSRRPWLWLVIPLLPLLTAMRPSAPQAQGARAWLHHQSAHARSLRYLLIPVFDWDSDGAPVTLGGSDCDPWNAAIYPGAHEVPGNGRDDNCLGGDGLPAQATRRTDRQPNEQDVLLLSLDALRFDATTALARTREAMSSYAIFTRAVSPSPQTIDSLPSTLRGRPLRQMRMSRHPELPIRGPIRDPHPTIGTVLVRHGYRAIHVPTHRYLDASSGVANGFEKALTPSFAHVRKVRPGLGKANPIVRAEEVFAQMRGELRATPGPILLWAHLMESHHPYYWGEREFGPNDITGYLRAMEDLDRKIAVFVRELARIRGRAPLLVVWGDHGEEFGEHGGYHHATSVYAEQTRVGFLIGGPFVPAVRHDGPVSLTALPATILDLLGLPPEPSFVEPSLLPCMTNRPGECPEVAVSELRFKGRFVIGYTSRTHRLLWDPVYDVEALFDSQRDPYEQQNLASSDPAILAAHRAMARRWDERH